MSEGKLSEKVLKTLSHLDAIPVDNPRRPGTPDVNYVEGWLELKYLPEWPKRDRTIVTIETWTPKQVIWHMKRSLAGGKTFLLVQVGGDYLLFEGGVASVFINKVTQQRMRELAIMVWSEYPGDRLCPYLK